MRRQRLFVSHYAKNSGGLIPAMSRPLLDASHVLAAANTGAAFDPDRVGIEFDNVARIGLAVVGVVY